MLFGWKTLRIFRVYSSIYLVNLISLVPTLDGLKRPACIVDSCICAVPCCAVCTQTVFVIAHKYFI